jgi:drug/metabolite transporter (DMT)-like permease
VDAKAEPGGSAAPAAVGPAVAQHEGRAHVTGILLMAFVAVAWGCNWPVNKFAFSEIPPLTYRTLCLIAGGVVLLAISALSGRARGIGSLSRRQAYTLIVCALFNVTAFHITAAYGLYLMEASQAIIISYTYPLWVVALGWMTLGEKITGLRAAGLLLGLGAILVLFYPAGGRFDIPLIGAVVMLLNAMSWAAGTIYYKAHRWPLDTVEHVGWQLVLGAIPAVIGAAILETPPNPLDLSFPVVLAAAYSLVISMALGHWAWFRAIDLISPVLASLITLINPVIGVLMSAWILGDAITPRKLIALCLAVASLTLVLIGPAGLRALGLQK